MGFHDRSGCSLLGSRPVSSSRPGRGKEKGENRPTRTGICAHADLPFIDILVPAEGTVVGKRERAYDRIYTPFGENHRKFIDFFSSIQPFSTPMYWLPSRCRPFASSATNLDLRVRGGEGRTP